MNNKAPSMSMKIRFQNLLEAKILALVRAKKSPRYCGRSLQSESADYSLYLCLSTALIMSRLRYETLKIGGFKTTQIYRYLTPSFTSNSHSYQPFALGPTKTFVLTNKPLYSSHSEIKDSRKLTAILITFDLTLDIDSLRKNYRF